MLLLISMNPKFRLPLALEKFLETHMDEYSPKANELLVEQGSIPKYAYFIIRGYIYVSYLDDEGNLHAKRFYKEKDFVAFISFLERSASPYTLRAGRDTLLSRISQEDMQQLFTNWTEMRRFFDLMVINYDETHDKIRNRLLGMTMVERVAEFYLELYPCLLPANKVRQNALIGKYLKVSVRRLHELRAELGLN